MTFMYLLSAIARILLSIGGLIFDGIITLAYLAVTLSVYVFKVLVISPLKWIFKWLFTVFGPEPSVIGTAVIVS